MSGKKFLPNIKHIVNLGDVENIDCTWPWPDMCSNLFQLCFKKRGTMSIFLDLGISKCISFFLNTTNIFFGKSKRFSRITYPAEKNIYIFFICKNFTIDLDIFEPSLKNSS